MKGRASKLICLIMVLLSSVFWSVGCVNTYVPDVPNLPVLPQPIAKEPVLITSAGQSTDTYIIKDIANQLVLHNFFMPQAKEANLKDINTLVFVIGYSPMGEKLHGLGFEDERKRIIKLLDNLHNKDLTIVTIFIGGRQRRGAKSDEFIRLICPRSDYIISTRDANYDNLFGNISDKENIPLTLVRSINDISEPFASAFR